MVVSVRAPMGLQRSGTASQNGRWRTQFIRTLTTYGQARLGLACSGRLGPGVARRGTAWFIFHGKARPAQAWRGAVWSGAARRDTARCGMAWFITRGLAGLSTDRSGMAWCG